MQRGIASRVWERKGSISATQGKEGCATQHGRLGEKWSLVPRVAREAKPSGMQMKEEMV